MRTFYDLFAGIGGFRIGMEKAGFRCVGGAEIDRHAREVYRKNFGEYPIHGDITAVDAGDVPDHDVLCAGFPCQAFSYAGKRLGFDDTRGTLFFEIARIARQKRPRLLFLENVKGLLTHDNYRTFATIYDTLHELGYVSEWQVINGKYFLPQSRDRVFIVSHLGTEPIREVFPLGDYDEVPSDQEDRTNVRCFTAGGNSTGLHSQMTLISHDVRSAEDRAEQVVKSLDANYAKGPDKHGQRSLVAVYEGEHPTDTVYSVDGIAPSLLASNARNRPRIEVKSALIHSRGLETRNDAISHCIKGAGGGSSKNFVAMLTPDQVDKRQVGRRCKEEGEPMFTLTHQDRHGVTDGQRVRRLTPLECERLQGFPDSFTAQGHALKGDVVWSGRYRVVNKKDGREVERPIMMVAPSDGLYPITDSARYRLLGNAVMPPVVEYIARNF